MPNGPLARKTALHPDPDSMSPGGFSFLFPPGERPNGADIAAFLAAPDLSIAAQISHSPASAEGWVEILANGLTFDLRGLAPASPAGIASARHVYGFEQGKPDSELEPIELIPSRHIAAGARLEPVVRALVALAANMALRLHPKAVVWQPGQTLMEPRYFSRVAFNWLSGGSFPALGLTALVFAEDGSIVTRGLAHFIGREMELEGRQGEPQADSVKLAIRLVDQLVRHGPVREAFTISLGTEKLLAEPSRAGRRIWIGREGA